MNLEKRKCHKGSQHTGRSIQALCLEPNCTNDRLLCFYCIHESHHNHSIAYLISGLKSPLELLNKNSLCQNPQKNLKYIENRFKRLNKGWLKISDSLQNGITQIEKMMNPQFNVIRETFKKNSVDQIIQQLTSNDITSKRIEEYVEMINMVKKYKFDNVNKLKFMAFAIEQKLSRIFLNANTKIKEIMNHIIEETNEMNFLNFNLDQLIKDRTLYLEVSKNLAFCRITDLEINSLNYELFCGQTNPQVIQIYEIQSNQIGEERNQIDEMINGKDQRGTLVIMEGAPIQEQLNQVHFYQENIENLNLRQQKSQSRISQEQNVSNDQILVEQNQQNNEELHSNQQSVNSQAEQSESESHSNGFRSYKRAFQQQKNSRIQQHQYLIIQQQQNLRNFPKQLKHKPEMGKIQYEEGQIWSNDEQNQKSEAHASKEIQHPDDKPSNREPKVESMQNLQPKFDEENFYSEKQFREAYGVESNSQKQFSVHSQNLENIQKNQEPQSSMNLYNNESIEDKMIEEKAELLSSRKAQEHPDKMNDQDLHYPKEYQHNSQHLLEKDKALSEFSCQFPSVNDNGEHELINSEGFQQYEDAIGCEHETEDENFMPSYHFSLSINSAQMTLSNTFKLKQYDNPNQQIQQPVLMETFNENNLFDEFFGDNKEGQNGIKNSKHYDILKKYFVLYNGQNSDESSEEMGPVPPKRAKWVEDFKKQPRQKSDEKPPKKKLKLPQSIKTFVNDMEFLDYPRTRTRSERIKLAKILQNPNCQTNNQSKQITEPKKGSKKYHNKSIYKQEEDSHQISEQDPGNQNDPQAKQVQDRLIIREAQIQEEESQTKLKQKNKHQNYEIQERQSLEDGIVSQSQKDSQSQNDEEQIIQQSQGRNENENKQKQHPKQKHKKIISPIEKFNHQFPSSPYESQRFRCSNFASTNQTSFKLDRHALTQVSHSLLNKYQREFIKEEIYKKQTDEEEEDKKIKIKIVHLNGRFHEQIKKRLSLLDENYIEELTIYCDTMDCAINQESVTLICKMTKLKKLSVYWTYRLPKTLTKKIISSLPLLEQLVLCELQDLDTEIANEIVSKLPHLKRLHYASDYMKNLDKMEENLEFLIDFVGTSTKLAPLFILSKLKNLETFWASDIDDIKQVKQILTKMKTLKQVSISAFEKRNKDLNSIFSILSKRNTLICLSLQGLQFKEDSLVSIIRNNPNLNTLIINECPTVSNNTLTAVADTCLDLEQLFLMLTDSLEGQRIFQLKNLKTLVVRACWSINVTKFRQGIKKLKNLRYLSLNMNNYWLNDDMLPSISVLPNLVFLNLDTTKVTDKGMQHLVGLKHLNTLICGRTEITSAGLYKFLEKSKSQIKKLGLSRESNEQLNRPQKINKHDVIYTEFEGKFLVKIGELLPQLTHLSIGGFKNLYIQNFATLDNLKCLEYKMESLPEETEKFLETTRLNMNANY